MKYPQFVKDYSKLNESALDVKAGVVVAKLTGNTDFPDPVPSLADFTLLKNKYSTCLVNAASGDKTAIALKNQAKLDLLNGMRQLAVNLQAQSDGDRTKMASTGLDIASDGSSAPPLAAPKNFKLLDGPNVGELKSIVKGSKQAIAYSHEYSLQPPGESEAWISNVNTYVEHTFRGLPSGTRVYVRVAAKGRKNQTVYTNVLSRIVQ